MLDTGHAYGKLSERSVKKPSDRDNYFPALTPGPLDFAVDNRPDIP
jgi:hypothetical protein